MGRFFHVDRNDALSVGQTLALEVHRDIDPPFLQKHVDGLFPDGVTLHGDRYLLDAGSNLQVINPTLELVWEYARRTHRPDAPSRYQSVFAWETLTDAERFRVEYGIPQAVIWEVEAHEAFRADMHLLAGHTALLASHCAVRYWNGEANFDVAPLWELLLRPPVQVLQQTP